MSAPAMENTMPIVRFFECSIPNPGGKPPFVEGIRAEIVIDSKSNLHYEFPAMRDGEAPNMVLARAPHELRTNFPDQLIAYLNGQQGVTGTPLDVVAGISRAQAENLRSAGIHTVEDLVSAPDPVLEHMGAMGSRLREIGKVYLDEVSGGSGNAEISALKQQNTELRAQMEEMQATFLQMLDEMKAEQSAQTPEGDPQPAPAPAKRTRTPK